MESAAGPCISIQRSNVQKIYIHLPSLPPPSQHQYYTTTLPEYRALAEKDEIVVLLRSKEKQLWLFENGVDGIIWVEIRKMWEERIEGNEG